jgi:hypothetical protein
MAYKAASRVVFAAGMRFLAALWLVDLCARAQSALVVVSCDNSTCTLSSGGVNVTASVPSAECARLSLNASAATITFDDSSRPELWQATATCCAQCQPVDIAAVVASVDGAPSPTWSQYAQSSAATGASVQWTAVIEGSGVSRVVYLARGQQRQFALWLLTGTVIPEAPAAAPAPEPEPPAGTLSAVCAAAVDLGATGCDDPLVLVDSIGKHGSVSCEAEIQFSCDYAKDDETWSCKDCVQKVVHNAKEGESCDYARLNETIKNDLKAKQCGSMGGDSTSDQVPRVAIGYLRLPPGTLTNGSGASIGVLCIGNREVERDAFENPDEGARFTAAEFPAALPDSSLHFEGDARQTRDACSSGLQLQRLCSPGCSDTEPWADPWQRPWRPDTCACDERDRRDAAVRTSLQMSDGGASAVRTATCLHGPLLEVNLSGVMYLLHGRDYLQDPCCGTANAHAGQHCVARALEPWQRQRSLVTVDANHVTTGVQAGSETQQQHACLLRWRPALARAQLALARHSALQFETYFESLLADGGSAADLGIGSGSAADLGIGSGSETDLGFGSGSETGDLSPRMACWAPLRLEAEIGGGLTVQRSWRCPNARARCSWWRSPDAPPPEIHLVALRQVPAEQRPLPCSNDWESRWTHPPNGESCEIVAGPSGPPMTEATCRNTSKVSLEVGATWGVAPTGPFCFSTAERVRVDLAAGACTACPDTKWQDGANSSEVSAPALEDLENENGQAITNLRECAGGNKEFSVALREGMNRVHDSLVVELPSGSSACTLTLTENPLPLKVPECSTADARAAPVSGDWALPNKLSWTTDCQPAVTVLAALLPPLLSSQKTLRWTSGGVVSLDAEPLLGFVRVTDGSTAVWDVGPCSQSVGAAAPVLQVSDEPVDDFDASEVAAVAVALTCLAVLYRALANGERGRLVFFAGALMLLALAAALHFTLVDVFWMCVLLCALQNRIVACLSSEGAELVRQAGAAVSDKSKREPGAPARKPGALGALPVRHGWIGAIPAAPQARVGGQRNAVHRVDPAPQARRSAKARGPQGDRAVGERGGARVLRVPLQPRARRNLFYMSPLALRKLR